MKKVAGTLKLDQAQYRELEAFAKFGSDLDLATLAVLDKGSKNVEILKQGQYKPVPVEQQIAILFCGAKGLLKSVRREKVREFEKDYLELIQLKHKDLLAKVAKGDFDDATAAAFTAVAEEVAKKYSS
jgi:F-type H+-transporting ATPase subunit alpha